MKREFLLERNLCSTYKRLRKQYIEDFGCKVYQDNGGRVIFIDDDYRVIYKLAKNRLGIEVNKKEIEISKLNDCFLKADFVYDNEYIIIKHEFSFESNSFQPVWTELKTNPAMTMPNIRSGILSTMIQYSYFLKDNRYINREIPIEYITNNYTKIESDYKALSLNFSNTFIHKLIDISLQFNIEPAELSLNSFFINNKLKVLQFGLTEDIFMNNMKTIFLKKRTPTDIFSVRTSIYKQFNGSWQLDDNCLKNIERQGFSSLEEFYKINFGEDIDFSNFSIYNKNNSFIKMDVE